MNQGQTKERPKNAKSQNMRFINIAISFPSLIPCLILPTDDRENTERRAKRYRALAAKNSALFLRLYPEKVDFIPEKVVTLPKTVDLHFSPLHPKPEKSRQNMIFLAYLEKKVYLCAQID